MSDAFMLFHSPGKAVKEKTTNRLECDVKPANSSENKCADGELSDERAP